MKRVAKFSFTHTIPIMAGYLFLGASFGILAQSQGISTFLTILMSVVVFAGSMQFAAVGILTGPFQPLAALILTLTINARHIFYGLTLLQPYRKLKGWRKFYTIFGLTDETFSLNAGLEIPPELDSEKVFFTNTLLNHFYWICGTVLGVVLSSWMTINTQGIEFVLTALFVTIFTEQWLSNRDHFPAILAIVVSIVNIIIFGPGDFLIPTMIILIVVFYAQFQKESRKEISYDA